MQQKHRSVAGTACSRTFVVSMSGIGAGGGPSAGGSMGTGCSTYTVIFASFTLPAMLPPAPAYPVGSSSSRASHHSTSGSGGGAGRAGAALSPAAEAAGA